MVLEFKAKNRLVTAALCVCARARACVGGKPVSSEDEPALSHILPFHSAHTELGASSCVSEASYYLILNHLCLYKFHD